MKVYMLMMYYPGDGSFFIDVYDDEEFANEELKD